MAEHTPVLLDEVLAGLAVRPDGRYCDATFGRGGHTAAVLGALGPAGRLVAIDRDPEAIRAGRQRFAAEARLTLVQGSFGSLEERVRAAGFEGELDGVLLDLGVSSPQLDEAARGFSFMQDGPLDMRMDPDSGESAAEFLARATETEIADVLWAYGEERMSRRIARAIVARRPEALLTRTAELADLVRACIGRGEPGKHPATRTFQALRIYLNRELDDLVTGLAAALSRLKRGGRLAVISFHSLEDRQVKQFMHGLAKPAPGNRRLPVAAEFKPTLALIGGAIRAEADELATNPRARSAVLRVAEKLA